ncbi:MAG: hypothetical protein Q4G18_03705 [Myroides sp.]|nr:hypothetical protein [Myroides sp.]
MELIYALLCILGSSFYLFYLLKNKKDKTNFWDISMNAKGFLGGLIILVIGIILFIKNTIQ